MMILIDNIRPRLSRSADAAPGSNRWALSEHRVPVQRPVRIHERLFPRLLAKQLFEFQFETHIYGLGYSLVELTIPMLQARARLWVLPTSIDAERITLRLSSSLKTLAPGKIHPALGLLPLKLLTEIAADQLFRSFVHDTRQDFPIWQHKKYISPPALAEGDGPNSFTKEHHKLRNNLHRRSNICPCI